MATTAGTTDRHFCWPFPRGTLLMLVMSCLLFGTHWFAYWSIEFSLTGMYRVIPIMLSVDIIPTGSKFPKQDFHMQQQTFVHDCQ